MATAIELGRVTGDRAVRVDVIEGESEEACEICGVRPTAIAVQVRRIRQAVAQAWRDERRRALARDATPSEDAADHLRQVEALTDRERRRGIVPAPAPAATADGALDRRPGEIGRCAQVANSGTTSRLRAM